MFDWGPYLLQSFLSDLKMEESTLEAQGLSILYI